MSAAIPWLPDCALASAENVEPVARCLRDWSQEWLAGGCLSAPPRWERPGGMEALAFGTETLRERPGFRLLLREGGRRELLSALLGRAIGERDLRSTADRRVTDHLFTAAMEALGDRLAALLPRSAPGEEAGSFLLPISCGGQGMVLGIEAGQAVLVEMARERAGSPRPVERPEPLAPVLGAQPVRLSARIGSSRLPLAELESLGIGDVLTLDTPIDDPLDACIEGKRAAAGALTLVPAEDRFSLQLERPTAQW